MTSRIAVADTDTQIDACWPVMSELRPHISRADFLPFVKRLAATNQFRLAFLEDEGAIKAVAGYRLSEWLAGGRYLEIEDLVTAADTRSRGLGGELFDWLVAEASRQGCRQVRLVSNVRRVDAHRFYLRKGMTQEAYYFSITIQKG